MGKGKDKGSKEAKKPGLSKKEQKAKKLAKRLGK